MSRTVVLAIALAVLATIGLGLAVAVSPGSPALTVEIYLLVVAVLVLSALVLRVARAIPRAGAVTPSRPPPRGKRLGQLESVAQALELAETSSFDLHNRLRPIVREVAAARLTRRGVALDRQPQRARALLGESAWELVRADRKAPFGRGEHGCGKEELREIVAALEAI